MRSSPQRRERVLDTKTIRAEKALQALFGASVEVTCLSAEDKMGRRVTGLNLRQALTESQAKLLVSLLDEFSLLTFAAQNRVDFSVTDLERLANHFGAPIPHPKNYANYMAYQRQEASLMLKSSSEQTATRCGNAFPEVITCLEGADSPAVYLVNNLVDSGWAKKERVSSGLHWHTDIEFERVPLSTSMFYVQTVPRTRDHAEQWVPNQLPEAGFYHPASSPELMARRLDLPLNGETAYADSAAAFADLPRDQQLELLKVQVRRRLKVGDKGWLIPLVYENPRNGMLSLHSPVWASRGKNIAPAQVEGLSSEASREFFDALEQHVLDPKYRYDHVHQEGDVTVWSNFSTLHNAPPAKSLINRPEDARLMYRISCKGSPSYKLPRNDNSRWIHDNITPPYRTPEVTVAAG